MTDHTEKPNSKPMLEALPGFVNLVVGERTLHMTPAQARKLAENLIGLAFLAECALPDLPEGDQRPGADNPPLDLPPAPAKKPAAHLPVRRPAPFVQ